MARTTFDLDPDVLDELRRRAHREHKTMGQVASEALARGLDDAEARDGDGGFTWITRDLGQPMVDLEDEEVVRRALARTT